MTELATTIIAIANIFLVLLIFSQVRQIYKPIITTKILSQEKAHRDVTERPQVLEMGGLYLVVSNVSTNLASDLRITYEFLLGDKKLVGMEENLEYLNPNEATKLVLELIKIKEEYPELFEVRREHTIKVIPKETLHLILNVRVSYGSSLSILKHEIKDSYFIEWGSLETYPNFDDHPVINCWNKRNNLYIYKVGENYEKTVNS